MKGRDFMGNMDLYIAKLWEPDKYIAHDYADMDIPEIEEVIRAKRAGKRGRPPYSIEDLAFYIWIDSVVIDPLEGLNFDFDPQDVLKEMDPQDILKDFDPKDVLEAVNFDPRDILKELDFDIQEDPKGKQGKRRIHQGVKSKTKLNV